MRVIREVEEGANENFDCPFQKTFQKNKLLKKFNMKKSKSKTLLLKFDINKLITEAQENGI